MKAGSPDWARGRPNKLVRLCSFETQHYGRLTMAPDGTRPARFEGHEYPQTLPEPDDIRAGALAPWSALSLAARTGLSFDLVESRLKDSIRPFENSVIPGDPSSMAVADIEGQPIT